MGIELSALRQILSSDHNVRLACLFGSAARGDDTPESDIDLLVSMSDSSFIQVVDLSVKLEELLGRRVDVVTLEGAMDAPHLLAAVGTEGRVLVDRDGQWDKLEAEANMQTQRSQRQDERRAEKALSGIDRMLAR